MKYLTTEYDKKLHKKNNFLCSKEPLTIYLQNYAGQDSKRNLVKVYVITNANSEIIGYYTLTASSLPIDAIPNELLKRPPKGYTYPCILIGRLAIHSKEEGKGYGTALLADAVLRSIEASTIIGTAAISVLPIDKNAKKFYDQFGFVELVDNPHMIMKIDEKLLGKLR